MKRRPSSRPSKHWPSSGNAAKPDNGPLFTRKPDNYANMERECRITKTRLSHSACLAQSVRTPDKCAGCPNEVKV
jgi:hypothetical protein